MIEPYTSADDLARIANPQDLQEWQNRHGVQKKTPYLRRMKTGKPSKETHVLVRFVLDGGGVDYPLTPTANATLSAGSK